MTLKHTQRRDLLHDANPASHDLGLASEAGAGGLTELQRLRRQVAASDLAFDYEQIEPACRHQVITAALDIKTHGRRAQESLLTIGQHLLAVKALLPHGQFSAWVAQEFHFTQRTAQNLMHVAERFHDKSETVSLFGDAALYLLAAPSTPDTAITAAIDAATATASPLSKRQVKAIIRTHQAPDSCPVPSPDALSFIWQATERNSGDSDVLRLAWLANIDSASLAALLPASELFAADVLAAAHAQVLTTLRERLGATLAHRNAARIESSAMPVRASLPPPTLDGTEALSLELTHIASRIQVATALATYLPIASPHLADCARLIKQLQKEVQTMRT